MMFSRRFLLQSVWIGKRSKYTFAKIRDLKQEHVGSSFQIKGWVKTNRSMKKFFFFDINDGSTSDNLQVVLEKETTKNHPDLGFGASVIVSGKLSTAPRGNLELVAENFKLIGNCPISDGYPFVLKQTHPPEYIRNYLHLRTQISSFRSLLRVRHLATNAFHKYFDQNGFTCIHTPVITSNSCEGAGELFSIVPFNNELLATMQSQKVPTNQIYFNKNAFLTVSGQLHLEAMCKGLGSVYNFGPAFRAENSKSPIHMSEFYMIESEECFIDGVDDITKRIETMIKTITNELLENHIKEIQNATLKSVQSDADRFSWLKKSFPTITYHEAIDILTKNSDRLKSPVDVARGLAKDHELFLVKHLDSPLFVINWPKAMKSFYMRECSDNSDLVEAIDFLMPMVGELAGGSVREDNIDILKQNLPTDLEWYLDLRKYGGCVTGGFGIGFDRYLQILLGIHNIKDCIPFPRWPHNCSL